MLREHHMLAGQRMAISVGTQPLRLILGIVGLNRPITGGQGAERHHDPDLIWNGLTYSEYGLRVPGLSPRMITAVEARSKP